MKTYARAVASVAMMVVIGCAAHGPQMNAKMESPTQVYRIPPKQLLAEVKQIVSSPPLSLGVAEEKDGSILTGYQPFPGDWHVARRWRERTRYRITVIPDWNEPTAVSRIEVREMTEQQAAEGMQWHADPELQRPERAAELLKKLDEQIRAKTGGAK